MSRRRERGVVLAAAVTALAVMTALALGLARSTILDQRTTHDALAEMQADALLRSAVAAASIVLQEAAALDAPDTLQAPWARSTGRAPLGAGWVEVRIEDDARRLDVGDPELAAALPRLLAVLGLDPSLAEALADWTDPDDDPRSRGAERAAYAGIVPPNGPLRTFGELGRIRGFDAGVMARLRPQVGVAGEHVVNPNTASRAVLLALLDDPAAVARVLAARARGPLDADAITALLPDLPPTRRPLLAPRGQRYTVRAVAGVGTLRRAVEASLGVIPGTAATVVGWRPVVPADGDA